MISAYSHCKGRAVVLTACLAVLITGCYHPYGFTLKQNYIKKNFSGRDLSGYTISMAPLLTGKGPDTSGMLNPLRLTDEIKKSRPDLALVNPQIFEGSYADLLDSSVLDEFYQVLYKGDVLFLQTADSLWTGVKTPYLMVLRLKKAVKLRHFDASTRSRITIEGELWNKDSMEVVWRVAVNGINKDARMSDSRFLFEAVRQIYATLPKAAPSYGEGTW